MAWTWFKRKFHKKKVRKFLKGRRRITLLIIIVALIIFRLFLPIIVKNYVNRVLNHIPGYHGYVDDIDISIWRGAYTINGLHLYKNGDKKPMLDFVKTDIQIEWRSLFKGKIVSRVNMFHPLVAFYINKNKLGAKQKPRNEDWSHALKKLIPIRVNRLTITDGEFLYMDILESPDINMSIHNISLVANNLSNVEDRANALPSDYVLNGNSFGNGRLNINGGINFLKKIPDVDMNISLRKANATALNTFTLASAGFDFESGQFELYSEIAIRNNYMKGYLKPMFHDVHIPDSAHQPNSSFFKRVWEGLISFFGYVLSNKHNDTFATKIPIEGDLSDPQTKLWTIIKNIFRNAFIRPFKNEVDNEIRFGDANRNVKSVNQKNPKPVKQKNKKPVKNTRSGP